MSQPNTEGHYVPASQDLLTDLYLESLYAYDQHTLSVVEEERSNGKNFQKVARLALSTYDGASLVLEHLEYGRKVKVDGHWTEDLMNDDPGNTVYVQLFAKGVVEAVELEVLPNESGGWVHVAHDIARTGKDSGLRPADVSTVKSLVAYLSRENYRRKRGRLTP